jgi:four helix bundle protein
MSLGSLAEVKYLLTFSSRLGFLATDDFEGLLQGYEELGKKLWKFYEKVREA